MYLFDTMLQYHMKCHIIHISNNTHIHAFNNSTMIKHVVQHQSIQKNTQISEIRATEASENLTKHLHYQGSGT